MLTSAVWRIYSHRKDPLAFVGGKGRRIAKRPAQWARLKYATGEVTVDREATLSNSNDANGARGSSDRDGDDNTASAHWNEEYQGEFTDNGHTYPTPPLVMES